MEQRGKKYKKTLLSGYLFHSSVIFSLQSCYAAVYAAKKSMSPGCIEDDFLSKLYLKKVAQASQLSADNLFQATRTLRRTAERIKK